MPRRRPEGGLPASSVAPPAKTLEGRERQMTALAMDLAEKRIRDGTASAQEVVHFLKLGTRRYAVEQEKLQRENELLEVKAEVLRSQRRTEELYAEALQAMRKYGGNPGGEEPE